MQVIFEGGPALQAKLTKLGDPHIFDDFLTRSAARLQARLAHYPTRPRPSSYRRTGTLGRRWTISQPYTPSDGGRQIDIGNNTEYAPAVKSALEQAWPFRGIWPTEAQDLESERPTITADYERTVDQIVKE
jgi:hypothetical protein